MSDRECRKCFAWLPVSDFGNHAKKEDGLQTWCRACRSKYDREHRPQKRERDAKNRKAWRAKNRHKMLEYFYKYRAQDPQKVKCRLATRNAIKHGRLVRGICEVCKSTNTQAHHDDYTKPFDVRWLCPLHHSHYHQNLRKAA